MNHMYYSQADATTHGFLECQYPINSPNLSYRPLNHSSPYHYDSANLLTPKLNKSANSSNHAGYSKGFIPNPDPNLFHTNVNSNVHHTSVLNHNLPNVNSVQFQELLPCADIHYMNGLSYMTMSPQPSIMLNEVFNPWEYPYQFTSPPFNTPLPNQNKWQAKGNIFNNIQTHYETPYTQALRTETSQHSVPSLSMSNLVDPRGRAENWSHEETIVFLNLILQHQVEFESIGRNQNLWLTISHALGHAGYNRSVEKCKNRWKVLVAKYKRCVERLKKDGGSEIDPTYISRAEGFEFYDLLRRLLSSNYGVDINGKVKRIKKKKRVEKRLERWGN